jgi:sensor histidine kinase regulating citrate/malate metabolism
VKDWLLANLSPIIVVILVILGVNLLGSALLLFG